MISNDHLMTMSVINPSNYKLKHLDNYEAKSQLSVLIVLFNGWKKFRESPINFMGETMASG